MKNIDRQKIKWGIESVEFASRGLMEHTGSQVRVKKIRISEKDGYAKANIDVFAGGESTLIKGQTYILDGLWMWINSLTNYV